MGTTYLVHIAAGALGLISGFVALYAAKGAKLHRKSGMVFVYAMLTMSVFGTAIAAVRGVAPAIISFGFEALANGGTRNGMLAFPFFMFGVVGLLASAGDLRVMRSGALQGAARLARHLWRMCFSLFIAALSFFIGQAKVLHWLWRVRVRRSFRGIVAVAAPEAA